LQGRGGDFRPGTSSERILGNDLAARTTTIVDRKRKKTKKASSAWVEKEGPGREKVHPKERAESWTRFPLAKPKKHVRINKKKKGGDAKKKTCVTTGEG